MKRFLFTCVCAVFVLGSCDGSTSGRVCQPVPQEGCNDGKFCTVGAEGAPVCITPIVSPHTEGEACEAEDDCDEGLGCARVGGAARCLRFCKPDSDDCTTGGTHPFTANARCVAAIVDRPDIGLCVLPCRPGHAEDCPNTYTCHPSLTAGMALCAPPGPGQEDEACGPERGCGRQLACVPRGEGYACRSFPNPDGCAPDTRPQSIPGVVDLIDNTEITVCTPCVSLITVPGVSLCLKARAGGDCADDPENAGCRCAHEGGRLAVLSAADRIRVAAAVTLFVQPEDPLWVAGEAGCSALVNGQAVNRECALPAAALCELARIDADR